MSKQDEKASWLPLFNGDGIKEEWHEVAHHAEKELFILCRALDTADDLFFSNLCRAA